MPTAEFRTTDISSPEPADRTAAGTVAGTGGTLDLGTVDTTDEARDTPVRVIWWRITDMGDATAVSNIRVWIEPTDDIVGDTVWHLDITDTWRRDITPVEVKTGTPGTAPASRPAANLTRMGGGDITGTGHDQTSQYIYITGSVAVNETTGDKTGPLVKIAYDYH